MSPPSEIQESREFILDGRRVVLIDTPGFDNIYQSDAHVWKSIAVFLGESYVEARMYSYTLVQLTEMFRYSTGAKLAGVIYVHRISDTKFRGTAVNNFRTFRKLCGDETLKNVILMTNMWGEVTPQQGADREQQLRDKYFKAAIEKGARLCRHSNTPESARMILRKILKNKPLVLKIQHELIDECKDIGETWAGAELNRETRVVVERYQREIRELEKKVREMVDEKNEGFQKELEEKKRRVQEETEKFRRDSAEMESKLEKARWEMRERINTGLKGRMGRTREVYEAEIRKYEESLGSVSWSGTDAKTRCGPIP